MPTRRRHAGRRPPGLGPACPLPSAPQPDGLRRVRSHTAGPSGPWPAGRCPQGPARKGPLSYTVLQAGGSPRPGPGGPGGRKQGYTATGSSPNGPAGPSGAEHPPKTPAYPIRCMAAEACTIGWAARRAAAVPCLAAPSPTASTLVRSPAWPTGPRQQPAGPARGPARGPACRGRRCGSAAAASRPRPRLRPRRPPGPWPAGAGQRAERAAGRAPTAGGGANGGA